jgi:hypothetical protein
MCPRRGRPPAEEASTWRVPSPSTGEGTRSQGKLQSRFEPSTTLTGHPPRVRQWPLAAAIFD